MIYCYSDVNPSVHPHPSTILHPCMLTIKQRVQYSLLTGLQGRYITQIHIRSNLSLANQRGTSSSKSAEVILPSPIAQHNAIEQRALLVDQIGVVLTKLDQHLQQEWREFSHLTGGDELVNGSVTVTVDTISAVTSNLLPSHSYNQHFRVSFPRIEFD